jgi:hypothetical protein
MPKDRLKNLYGLLRKFYNTDLNVAVFSSRNTFFIVINPAQFFI